VTVDQGLFPPDSVTRRINREQALLVGGGCALLLQIAHPLVAAGVADHSDFRSDPLRRLRRTLDATLGIVFGTTDEAVKCAATVRSVHARVRGTLSEDTGRFPAGTPYRAEDPDLLAWVQATLIDAGVRTYELLFSTLSDADREAYYRETKTVAHMLGLPDGGMPESYRAFASWYDARVASDEIAIGSVARELAGTILAPKLRFVPRPVFAPLSLMTVGLLPPKVREGYGFRWSGAREAAFRTGARAIGRTARTLPSRIRLFPQARAAERRSAGVAA
jgi:uncharacterized protein (DUF2236 family)